MRNLLLWKSLLLVFAFFMSVNSNAQVTQKWVQRENGDANNPDVANDLVIDHNSNVIVTGYSNGKGTGNDYATIKYTDDGNTKWIKRYNGPGNGIDQATADAVDGNGNVYVTGYSEGSGTSSDFATIKYDADGNTKWVKRFNVPGNGDDRAIAIAVDAEENVYVTGWSSRIGTTTGYDITTIKYNKYGDTKWVKSYDGLGFDDQPNDIAVDKNGNVYVTGYSNSNDIGTNIDYVTIKYDNNGNLQWAQKYNGPANSFDRANALALDDYGNAYVTGVTTTALSPVINTDIATIKYNAAGVQQWVAIYNNRREEAVAIAVDAAGNVHVLGATGSGNEDDDGSKYVTIKYNAAGVQQWAQLFSFPGATQGANPGDMALDAAGNVYVTGGLSVNGVLDYVTLKYNAAGVQQWVAVYNGPGNRADIANAIGIDKYGNVYITGFSFINEPDYATLKYNNSGERKWLQRYNGPGDQLKGGPDMANALALDAACNPHVTGGITRLNTGLDYATFKYETGDGDRIWKKTYNGPGYGPDVANAIAVDNNGNVYATGSSFGVGSLADIATVKYDAAGNSQWGKRYNGPANLNDQANAITVDNKGFVYVTGFSQSPTATTVANPDYVTIKYKDNGDVVWIKRYNGPGNSTDIANDIFVDANGNIYVTGGSSANGASTDYTTIKYDANGNQLWVARYNGPLNFSDDANALAVDGSGNVYVTGESFGSGTSIDYATVKYNAAGVQQWVQRYAGIGGDQARDIALDAAANVYVTGFSSGDYATIKYNTAGTQQWVAIHPGNNAFGATALALDPSGNVYVTGGSSTSPGNPEDYLTVKYNTGGVQQWEIRYNGPGNDQDIATDISLDAAGNVYITGRSTGNGTLFDYATIKYAQAPLVTMSSVTDAVPNNLAIEQRESAKLSVKAFPNAFTSYINLQWSGSDKPVTITITDDMGRLVEKRIGLASSGTLQTGNKFGKGVYFAEIIQGGEKIVLKLVKN
ncbi:MULTISPECIES: SBBP repeat-containing protein [Niastella]|uniref:SBBP repeat-containing protein n=1 Tax=Niastella soli TaxID=2821487 RepID=A0ABS3YUR4_9BACT|nr:SBBP repeat-containing protein [Niastella soli]MBO9201623.1 SBBP repeat-containing protein [Niastella soli]